MFYFNPFVTDTDSVGPNFQGQNLLLILKSFNFLFRKMTDPAENKTKFSVGFREVQESFYDLVGKATRFKINYS